MEFPFQQQPTHYFTDQMPHNHYPMYHVPQQTNQRLYPMQGRTSPSEKRGLQQMVRNLLPGMRSNNGESRAVNGIESMRTGGGVTSTLNNVQQVLNVVQQTAPIIKEYGPMVKNIPTMLRMVKLFNDNTSDAPTDKGNNEGVTDDLNDESVNHLHQAPATNGGSKPKLFI